MDECDLSLESKDYDKNAIILELKEDETLRV